MAAILNQNNFWTWKKIVALIKHVQDQGLHYELHIDALAQKKAELWSFQCLGRLKETTGDIHFA